MCGSRSGSPHPPEKSQNIGFSSNTCPDPLKNRSCEASIQYWAFIGIRWRADDGPLKVGLGSSLPSSTLKTNLVKVGSPLTKPGSAHESCPSTVKFQSSRFTRTACADPEHLSEGVVREDRNATKKGPPSAHQRNAIVDNGPPMNAGLVAL